MFEMSLQNKKIIIIPFLLLLIIAFAWLIALHGLLIALMGIAIPVGLLLLFALFKNPERGIWVLFGINYIVLGLTRYLPGSLGLIIDSMLVLIHLAVFFKYFHDKDIYKKARNPLMLLAALWYSYALFQLVNPEAVSRVAWFYAMRGVALHMLLTIPLVLMFLDTPEKLSKFFHLWMFFALLGVMKGMMQKFIGPDPWEQAWLDGGGSLTHVLFGKLRVFSFFSDAGQFGAAMGHAGVVFTVLALTTTKNISRIVYGLAAAIFFYGMLISGTRGAIAVPLGGFMLYLILSKNIRLIAIGSIAGMAFYIFIFHTHIGQGNYDIARLRTAFDKDNPSLQVRLENQRKLKSYMASKPLGGGIGSSGNWGQRFSPNTFLANTPTDSWYVMIWAEQGIIGLALHLGILFFIILRSSWVILFKIKNKWLRNRMIALVCGIFGIMAASYGNGILGQMPTGLIIYMSMAFLFMSEKMEDQLKNRIKMKTISENSSTNP
ncbi:MAG: O-antigen ligase family protein [Bacteroidales bacterium]|nr:O-antigen ligase family protein [Bacteroidales bacterium]